MSFRASTVSRFRTPPAGRKLPLSLWYLLWNLHKWTVTMRLAGYPHTILPLACRKSVPCLGSRRSRTGQGSVAPRTPTCSLQRCLLLVREQETPRRHASLLTRLPHAALWELQ